MITVSSTQSGIQPDAGRPVAVSTSKATLREAAIERQDWLGKEVAVASDSYQGLASHASRQP